jgi:hypothetical protein
VSRGWGIANLDPKNPDHVKKYKKDLGIEVEQIRTSGVEWLDEQTEDIERRRNDYSNEQYAEQRQRSGEEWLDEQTADIEKLRNGYTVAQYAHRALHPSIYENAVMPQESPAKGGGRTQYSGSGGIQRGEGEKGEKKRSPAQKDSGINKPRGRKADKGVTFAEPATLGPKSTPRSQSDSMMQHQASPAPLPVAERNHEGNDVRMGMAHGHGDINSGLNTAVNAGSHHLGSGNATHPGSSGGVSVAPNTDNGKHAAPEHGERAVTKPWTIWGRGCYQNQGKGMGGM